MAEELRQDRCQDSHAARTAGPGLAHLALPLLLSDAGWEAGAPGVRDLSTPPPFALGKSVPPGKLYL